MFSPTKDLLRSPCFLQSNLIILATFFLLSVLSVYAGVTQDDFSGIGNVLVLNSSDWRTLTPKDQVGCLDVYGKLISPDDTTQDCGVFSRMQDYLYALSSNKGNCTFNDALQETNSDSYCGKSDHA